MVPGRRVVRIHHRNVERLELLFNVRVSARAGVRVKARAGVREGVRAGGFFFL